MSFKNISIAILLGGFLSMKMQAQSVDVAVNDAVDVEDVEQVIINLFDAMREGDSVKLKSCFTDNVEMVTGFINKNGEYDLVKGSLTEFVKAVGSPHEEVWDERISNLKIRVDMNIAQAWCDYSFYLGEKQNHCGVDAFDLVKVNGAWKISYLADTRKKCNN